MLFFFQSTNMPWMLPKAGLVRSNTLLITSKPSQLYSVTRIFLNKRGSVHGVFYADSTGHSISFVTQQTKGKAGREYDISVSSLQNQSETIENYCDMHHPVIEKSNLSSSGIAC